MVVPVVPLLRAVSETTGVAERASLGPDLTRYALLCAGLVVGIALLAYGFRRFVLAGLKARAARRSLEVLDALPLGGKKSLAVVRCYERTFVLGLGEREVGLVAELFPEEAQAAPAAARSAAKSFDAELEELRPPPRATRASRAEGLLRALRRGEGVLG